MTNALVKAQKIKKSYGARHNVSPSRWEKSQLIIINFYSMVHMLCPSLSPPPPLTWLWGGWGGGVLWKLWETQRGGGGGLLGKEILHRAQQEPIARSAAERLCVNYISQKAHRKLKNNFYVYKNVSFALLDGWNVTETSFDHSWAGMEGSCFWAQGISRESGKIKGGSAGEGEMGEGGETWMENYSSQDLSNSSKRNQQGQCKELCNYGSWLSWL